MRTLALTAFMAIVLLGQSCKSGQKTDQADSTNRGTVPTSGCVQGKCDDGDGQFVYPNGDKYSGAFKSNVREGKGVLEYAGGDKYTGDFVSDKRSGNGTYDFANGDRYVGEFKDGERNGKGVYTFKEGPVFDGTFQNDGRSGNGNLKVADKTKTCVLQDRKIFCDTVN